MKASPAFQLYSQDFLVGTADMTAEEVGGYIRLLCYQWSKGEVPSNPSKLAVLSGCSPDALASIMHKFCISSASGLQNARMEEVRQNQALFRESRANNAKKGWEKRHLSSVNPPINPSEAQAMHMQSTSNALHTSSSSSSPTSNSNNTPPAPEGSGSGVKTPKPKLQDSSSDEVFLSQIKAHYDGINVDGEIHRMKAWLLTPAGKGKTLTRRRIVSWLNRCDRPVNLNGDKPENKWTWEVSKS